MREVLRAIFLVSTAERVGDFAGLGGGTMVMGGFRGRGRPGSDMLMVRGKMGIGRSIYTPLIKPQTPPPRPPK